MYCRIYTLYTYFYETLFSRTYLFGLGYIHETLFLQIFISCRNIGKDCYFTSLWCHKVTKNKALVNKTCFTNYL